MSRKLDEELAAAAKIGSDDEEAPAVAAPRPAPRPAASKNLALLVTLLVMVGALVTLFLVGFKEAAIYAVGVDQVVSDAKLVDRKVRVEGELVPGTLAKRDQPCEYRFTIKGTTTNLPVRYGQCVIPDTFRDVPEGGVQVTVEGTRKSSGEFEATLVMAKCTSKYDPETHQMKGDPAARAPEPGGGDPSVIR